MQSRSEGLDGSRRSRNGASPRPSLDGSRHSRNSASPRHGLDGSRHSLDGSRHSRNDSRNASPRSAGGARASGTPRRVTPPFPLNRASSAPTSPTQAARQKLPWLLAGLVGLVVAASAVDFGGKVWAHAGRSHAVRRALDTGLVLKLTHAVHETQTERGLVSTYVASAGRARKDDLQGQFRRTDAALDTAIGAVLEHAIEGPEIARTAQRVCAALDLHALRPALRRETVGYESPRLKSLEAACGRKGGSELHQLLNDHNATFGKRRDVFDTYAFANEELLAVARDASVELMRSGPQSRNLATSLFASVMLASNKEQAAVERGLVSAELSRRKLFNSVSDATRARLQKVEGRRIANLDSYLAFAPGGAAAFAVHQDTACVVEAEQMSAKLIKGGSTLPSHQKWFALQSCRIDSLQSLMDDLQATIKRDAAASQRSSFLRLLALGLPLVLLCVGAAAMGSRALLCLDQVERKLDRSQASEQKYKRLLLNWAPLSAWVGAVASDDDAIEDAADDDAAMRKAKTLARLQKSF